MARCGRNVRKVDNAGGGRRGVRPAVSSAIADAVIAAYGVSLSTARDLGGSASLNLLADDGRKCLVVRVYRSQVPAARVAAIQQVRAVLAGGGVPSASPIRTQAGAPFVEVDGHVVEVETFVESDATMNSLDRIAAALPVLAHVHALLARISPNGDIDATPFVNYVDPVGIVEAARIGTDRIRSWGPNSAERCLADAADRLAEAVALANEPFADLPVQLVHGDFWDNNVLFRDNRVVLVADLGFMGNRLRIDDLALTLFFTTYLLDDLALPQTFRMLERLVDAYDAAADPRLSARERAAIPVALARQPLWSIAVWAAQLDDATTARQHITGHLPAIQQAMATLERLDDFQDLLT